MAGARRPFTLNGEIGLRSRSYASVCLLVLLASAAAPLRTQSFMMRMQGTLNSRSFITGLGASSFGVAADDAGIVANFSGVSNPLVIGATGIRPTTFTGFNGVGVSSGVCLSGPPSACTLNAITPIPLTSGSTAYSLTLGSYSQDVGPGFPYSVRITAVPEPGSVLLVGMGALAIGVVARR